MTPNTPDDILLYECFLDKIEKSSTLNTVVLNILNKNLPSEIINKFLLWYHKKCIIDSKYSNALDNELINKMYSKLSSESLIKLLESINTTRNPCINQCNICQNAIENPHCYDCGHVFCLDCINKHRRSVRLRNNEYNCPQCRKPVLNDPIKIYL
jgi:hypothetical protein